MVKCTIVYCRVEADASMLSCGRKQHAPLGKSPSSSILAASTAAKRLQKVSGIYAPCIDEISRLTNIPIGLLDAMSFMVPNNIFHRFIEDGRGNESMHTTLTASKGWSRHHKGDNGTSYGQKDFHGELIICPMWGRPARRTSCHGR